jgi:hypothetical protein
MPEELSARERHYNRRFRIFAKNFSKIVAKPLGFKELKSIKNLTAISRTRGGSAKIGEFKPLCGKSLQRE